MTATTPMKDMASNEGSFRAEPQKFLRHWLGKNPRRLMEEPWIRRFLALVGAQGVFDTSGRLVAMRRPKHGLNEPLSDAAEAMYHRCIDEAFHVLLGSPECTDTMQHLGKDRAEAALLVAAAGVFRDIHEDILAPDGEW